MFIIVIWILKVYLIFVCFFNRVSADVCDDSLFVLSLGPDRVHAEIMPRLSWGIPRGRALGELRKLGRTHDCGIPSAETFRGKASVNRRRRAASRKLTAVEWKRWINTSINHWRVHSSRKNQEQSALVESCAWWHASLWNSVKKPHIKAEPGLVLRNFSNLIRLAIESVQWTANCLFSILCCTSNGLWKLLRQRTHEKTLNWR